LQGSQPSPGRTVLVLAVLFGVQLVLAGVFRFVAALASDDESEGTQVLLTLLGVLSFIVFTALSDRAMRDRGWTIFMGALSVVAGVVVLVYPGISLITLAVVLGVWLLVYGVTEIMLAFRLRSVGQAVTPIAAAI
jgi:uncharacterized membrane protein HdeD (DUF308 family)